MKEIKTNLNILKNKEPKEKRIRNENPNKQEKDKYEQLNKVIPSIINLVEKKYKKKYIMEYF